MRPSEEIIRYWQNTRSTEGVFLDAVRGGLTYKSPGTRGRGKNTSKIVENKGESRLPKERGRKCPKKLRRGSGGGIAATGHLGGDKTRRSALQNDQKREKA